MRKGNGFRTSPIQTNSQENQLKQGQNQNCAYMGLYRCRGLRREGEWSGGGADIEYMPVHSAA